MNLPALKTNRVLFAFAIICLPFLSTAQNDITVKGTVTDASTGKPIESANIVIQNSAKGTISDKEGNFSLTILKGVKISISFIGYETRTVSAATDFLTIQLTPDSSQLNVVVVTALGVKKE